MKFRTLGSTGLDVSVIGIGTWQLGGEWGKDFAQSDVNGMFARGRELGINLVDTAECYGDHLSEKLIGGAIAGDRDHWIVATKFGHHFHGAFDRTVSYDPDDVVKQLEGSLRALRTDYIDLYQFHSGPNDGFDTEGLWETLHRQQEAGKIRHLGISLGGSEDVHEHQMKHAREVGVEAIQVIYNRLDRLPESFILPRCQQDNLGVLTRLPLCSGYLTGKYKPGHSFPANDVREKWYKEGRDEKLIEANRILDEEVPQGVEPAQWALAWCLQHPAVTCVIPGCKSIDQVESNAAAANLITA